MSDVFRLHFLSFGMALGLLVIMQVIDFTTGYLLAARDKAVSSSLFRKGGTTKLIVLLIVLGIESFDVYLLSQGVPIPAVGKYAAVAAALWEFVSLFENAEKGGIRTVKYLRVIVDPMIKTLAVANKMEPPHIPGELPVTAVVQEVQTNGSQ